MLRKGYSVSAQLDPAAEWRKDRPLPLVARTVVTEAQEGYIDKTEIQESLPADKAQAPKRAVAPDLASCRCAYRWPRSPGGYGVDVLHQNDVESLSKRVDGDVGKKEPPARYAAATIVPQSLGSVSQGFGSLAETWQ